MYVNPNFTTKQALRNAVSQGHTVCAYSPGPFNPNLNGVVDVEGPHAPKMHTWYANVEVVNGVVKKVL
jgi:hypothetical protein